MAHKTRPVILRAFRGIDGFASARELHAQAVGNGDALGLATVYRELRRMVSEEIVDVVHDLDGEARYRHCDDAHHHHLVCERCGLTREIDGEEIETWIIGVAQSAGFHQIRHTIELVGLCSTCAS